MKYGQSRKNSIKEGAWWSVQNGCGDNYLTAFFELLGLKASTISFISTFPVLFGSLIQTFILKKFFLKRSKKKTLIVLCAIQGLCWPALIISAYINNTFLLVTLIMVVYYSVVSAQDPPWRAWMGSIVPKPIRGKYFGIRLAISGIVLLFSIAIAGAILENFSSSDAYLGFVIIFSLAFIGRIVSIRYWNRMFEPKTSDDNELLDSSNFDQDQTVYLKFLTLYQFSVNIIVPLWPVYFLRDIGFSYAEYSYILVSGNLIGILSHYFWGKFIDRFDSLFTTFLGGWIMAFLPLLWYFLFYLEPEFKLPYSIILFSIASFAASGANLGLNNWVLDIHEDKNIIAFSTEMVKYRGVAIFLGGITGGGLTLLEVPKITTAIPIGTSIHYAIFISSFMRLITMLSLSSLLNNRTKNDY